ncbi:MAG: hypothetical protein ACHQF2_01745 [Flavobacteriales bacterium]
MKKVFFIGMFILAAAVANASVAFFIHVRVPDAVKDVKQFYFELSNNGDTLFTELNDKFGPGYVFSETAESRIRKGKLEFLVRYSKNGKKWITDKIEVDVTAKEAEVHFYYLFGSDPESGKTKIEERTVYRIMKGDDKAKLGWKKSEDGKDSSIHFTNLADTSVYAIGHTDYAYGEMFRRNESNLFSVEWRGVNADNPCHNQKALKEVPKGAVVRMGFPNLQCNELKVTTEGKYQARIYVSAVQKPTCAAQGTGVQVCILDAKEYILLFDRK